MRIVFWENIVSQHKLPYWNFIADELSDVTLVVVVQEILPAEQLLDGWEVSGSYNFLLVVSPDLEEINELLAQDIKASFHVFSGIRAFPLVFASLKESLKYQKLNRILLTESVSLVGWRKVTRRIASLLIERKYRKYFSIVLASGLNTGQWYKECGFEPSQIYPFLYCTESDIKIVERNRNLHNFRLVFVGQLIHRKGIDILLKSLALLKQENWSLDIYGQGEEEKKLRYLTNRLGLDRKVNFLGIRRNKDLNRLLGTYDCLVLPSRFDGWGAVINEAIHAGIPVVCSDNCGAAILVCDSQIGGVFLSEDIGDLSSCLNNLIVGGPTSKLQRELLFDYGNYLSGKQVAKYLIDIILFSFYGENNKPATPWDLFLNKINSIKKNAYIQKESD